MNSAQIALAIRGDILAIERNPHPPADPFTADERQLEDLSEDERRARLGDLSKAELIELAIELMGILDDGRVAGRG